MYPRAAAFLLLWTIVVVGFENGTKNRSELLFSDEFPVDTRHLPAGYRRQKGPVDTPAGSHIPKQQKIIDDSFYKPYYHQGDMVFLRTTPKEGTPYNPYKEDSEYQKLEISDYRDCNLVCPSIFKNTGPVCAQREKQALYYRFWQTSGWPGTFYDGYWYWPYFKNFRSLCDLREANCRNYFTIENKWEDRNLWRLVHLGICPRISNYEKVGAQSSEVPFEVLSDHRFKASYFSEKRTKEILEVSRKGQFPTLANPKNFLNAPRPEIDK